METGDAHWDTAKVKGQWGVVGKGLEGVECLCGHAHDHGALWLGLDGIGVDMAGAGGAVREGHGGGAQGTRADTEIRPNKEDNKQLCY